MQEATASTPPSGAAKVWRVPPWVVAACVAAAAAAQTAVESVLGARPAVSTLLWGRAVPALLWTLAAPAVMTLGARQRPRRGRILVPVLLHAGAFLAWFLSSNLVVRLPVLARGDWDATAAGLRSAWSAFGPAAALLWVVLAGAGAWSRREEVRPGVSTPSGTPAPSPLEALPVPGLNRVHLVPIPRIRWIEADGDHVRVHTVDQGVLRMRGTLNELEGRLAGWDFLRIHRSTLVNVEHLREVQPLLHGDWVAVMDDGAELRVPRTRRRVLDKVLRGPDAPA